jgi:hypothetical protein
MKPGVPSVAALVTATTISVIVEQTRRISEGPLVVGEDLMAFVIGDSIAVERAR